MTGWCEAVWKAGASRVTAVQRFSKSMSGTLRDVSYHFVADGLRPNLMPWEIPALVHEKVAGEAPDVVHVNGKVFPLRALRQRLRSDVPLLWQHHGGLLPSWYTRWLHAFGFRHVDGVMFTSTEQAIEWRQHKILNHKIAVYEIPECSTHFHPLPTTHNRNLLNLMGKPVLLWVGRLNENKDPFTVLEGFRLVAPNSDAHLYMIYQTESLLEEVQKMIVSLNLNSRVHLVGKVPHDQLPSYYSAADFFVVGSHSEGSGFSLLESLACGLPGIVPDIPPFRKLTGNGRVAFLWEVGNPTSFARAFQSAMQQRLRRELVRAYFDEHLSFNALGTKAMQIYQAAFLARLLKLQRSPT